MLSFFPRDVLDEIWDLIESVSGGGFYLLLQQGYRYHKLLTAFSKFYRRHFEMVSKYNTGLRSLLLQGLSEPEFYGDLVYKF